MCGAADAACCCSLAGCAAGFGPLAAPPATSSCGSRQTLTTIAISRARKVLSSEPVARTSELAKGKIADGNGSAEVKPKRSISQEEKEQQQEEKNPSKNLKLSMHSKQHAKSRRKRHPIRICSYREASSKGARSQPFGSPGRAEKAKPDGTEISFFFKYLYKYSSH